MTVVKFAISIEKELAKQIRASAAHEPISNWLADAARRKLRFEGMQRVLEDYEAEFGKITAEDVEQARRELEEARRESELRYARIKAEQQPPRKKRRGR